MTQFWAILVPKLPYRWPLLSRASELYILYRTRWVRLDHREVPWRRLHGSFEGFWSSIWRHFWQNFPYISPYLSIYSTVYNISDTLSTARPSRGALEATTCQFWRILVLNLMIFLYNVCIYSTVYSTVATITGGGEEGTWFGAPWGPMGLHVSLLLLLL